MNNRFVALLLAAVLMVALPVTAMAATDSEGVLIKRVTITSTTKDLTYDDYDATITEAGTEYRQEGEIVYSVISTTPLTKQETLKHEIQSDPMYSKEMKAEPVLVLDGLEYALNTIVYEPAQVPNRAMTVSGYTVWTDVTAEPVPPEKKEVAYYDEATKTSAVASLPMIRFEQTSALEWRSFAPIELTFEVYDAELYLLGDLYVPYSDGAPALEGYDDQILAELQLDPEVYAIDGFEWAGDVYEEDGTRCRKAIATGRKYCASYRADYKDTVKLKDAPGWQGTAIYSAERTVETGEIEYTIEVSIPYVAVDKFPVIPVTAGGVTVGVGLVFWLSRPPVNYYNPAGKLVGHARIRRGKADVTKAQRKAGAPVTATFAKGYVRRHVGQEVTFVSAGTAIDSVRLPMTKDKFTHTII